MTRGHRNKRRVNKIETSLRYYFISDFVKRSHGRRGGYVMFIAYPNNNW